MKLHQQHSHSPTQMPSTSGRGRQCLLSFCPPTSTAIVLFILFLHTTSAKNFPCPFHQTINITDGLRLKDGSYSYEGLVIPANLTAEYKIKVIDGIEYSAPKHWRACACLLKPCVTFCCPPKMHFDERHQNCTPNLNEGHSQHNHIEVTFSNGSVNAVNIKEAFIIRYELGCKNKMVERNMADFWKWDLFERCVLITDSLPTLSVLKSTFSLQALLLKLLHADTFLPICVHTGSLILTILMHLFISSSFYSYCIYMLVLFSIWMREIIVYIIARIREHFFIIDYWSGICILCLAFVAFVYLLRKNKFVQLWWEENV
uniref:Methuselah N-terminal domain-containing protein n=1 Tax=Stomoxys calcitrans TaxID=35570 RepID=A0A1I8Q4H6_STOCA